MPISDYLENKDLDVWYGKQFSTIPATIYAQLHSGDPTDTGSANQITASSSPVTTFARAVITNNSTNWPSASGGSKTNGTKISWGSTAGLTFASTASWVSFWDAASGGNMLDYGQLAVAMTLTDRTEIFINAGSLTISRA